LEQKKKRRSNKTLDAAKSDAVNYASVKTWARSGLPESGERAEALLDYMNERVKDYDEEGRGYIHNSEDYYNNEDDANIVRPNVITYNSVMNAWSRSGSPNAAKKAESILKRLLSHPMGKGGELRPNGISFSTAIHAWSKSSMPQGAKRTEIF